MQKRWEYLAHTVSNSIVIGTRYGPFQANDIGDFRQFLNQRIADIGACPKCVIDNNTDFF